jgi:2'-5' RNA ligase
VRLFFAIEIPESVRANLRELQERLKGELGTAFRWTDPDLFHVTLAFLGEVSAERLGELRDRAEEACKGFTSATLHFQGLGCFPSARRPRILWAGVNTSPEIAPLGTALSRACASLGNGKVEETETLHVTLGRAKEATTRPNAEKVLALIKGEANEDLGSFEANEVLLFESILGRGPIRHEVVARFRLDSPA